MRIKAGIPAPVGNLVGEYVVSEGLDGLFLNSVSIEVVTAGASFETPRMRLLDKSGDQIGNWPIDTAIPILSTGRVLWQTADHYVEPGSVLFQLAAFSPLEILEGDRVQILFPGDPVLNQLTDMLLTVG
jgi:hypothetical protein